MRGSQRACLCCAYVATSSRLANLGPSRKISILVSALLVLARAKRHMINIRRGPGRPLSGRRHRSGREQVPELRGAYTCIPPDDKCEPLVSEIVYSSRLSPGTRSVRGGMQGLDDRTTADAPYSFARIYYWAPCPTILLNRIGFRTAGDDGQWD